MLEFADLNIDLKSFENTIGAYRRQSLNSYIPLIIMFLSKEGVLKVESNVNEDDPRVIFQITTKEILDFWGIEHIPNNLSGDLFESVLGIDVFDKELLDKYDVDVLATCAKMIERVHDGLTQSIVYDNVDNKDFCRIKKILCANSSKPKNPAAFWFLCELLIQSFPVNPKEEKRWSNYLDTAIFDSFIRLQSPKGPTEYMQPIELTRIILSQYRGGSVYNPFAGIGSYHVEMSHGLRKDVEKSGCDFFNHDCFYSEKNSLGEKYYAEEIDELTWAIGKLRLMFYHMDSPNYIHCDSTKKFETVVNNILCTPPFNLQITNEFGEKEYADHFVIRRGIKILADDGMMAVVVPVSFLNRKDTFDIRKDLVNSRMLSHVVFLPENIFPSTRISTAIIFVQNNTKRNRVKFVDATKMIWRSERNINILNIAAISNLIEHNEYPRNEFSFSFGENGFCDEITYTLFNLCVSFEKNKIISANDYDLSPSNFFSSYINIPKGFKLERLENLVSTIDPLNVESGIEGKVITNSELVKDYQFPFIDDSKLKHKTLKSNYILLNYKSLLVSSINDLRPSLYIPKGNENIYLSPNVLAFHLDDKKINAEYLIGELSKEYVKEQLRLKVMGSTSHRISHSDILSLQILVPDVKNFFQKEKEITQERKNDYFEKFGFELMELRDKRYDEYVKMLRQRKHRLQQIMNEFAPAFALLNKYRIEHGGVLNDNDVVAARTGETVSSYFDKLNTIACKIENLITNLVNKDNWGQSSKIDIDKFVDKIPQSHFSDMYEIQVFHNRSYEIYEEGEDVDLNDPRLIEINEDSLSTLFENIIANAIKWGFTDTVRNNYILRITVSDGVVNNQNAVRVSVMNNGLPIHESFDRSRFFEWGYGTGTGIGTSQLKDIVEHYGGSIKLNEYSDTDMGFCTEYEFVLPLVDND